MTYRIRTLLLVTALIAADIRLAQWVASISYGDARPNIESPHDSSPTRRMLDDIRWAVSCLKGE